MSSGTNAHPARAGFNQSGGAYFICLQNLDSGLSLAGTASANAGAGANMYINTISSAGSNSGGAWIAPTLALTPMSNVIGTGLGVSLANAAALVGQGKLLKDMGRTIISSGRTFRKFSPVVSGPAASTFGVTGGPATAPNTGYCSFYLEVGREGFGGPGLGTSGLSTPAPIARYF